MLLLRNNDWTRNVMDDMMHYGRQPVNFTLEEVCAWLSSARVKVVNIRIFQARACGEV